METTKLTVRHISDPHGSCTDADLISVLQHTWLLPWDGTSDPSTEAKFSLDPVVGDEGKHMLSLKCAIANYRTMLGSNYSAGEKQLLSLCRALVKNSHIIVLVS